jgi:hypothetical protein
MRPEKAVFDGGTQEGLDGQLGATDAATLLDYFASRGGGGTLTEPVCLCALTLLWLVGSLGHILKSELGYTHDTNSFSPKRH